MSDQDNPHRLKLPPIIWNYIEALDSPTASRFQKDIAMQMLEDISRITTEAVARAKASENQSKRRR